MAEFTKSAQQTDHVAQAELDRVQHVERLSKQSLTATVPEQRTEPLAQRLTESSLAQPLPEPMPEPMIVFDHVSISFGENAVLKDVSFHVARGQTLCILGRSGVGKSVALRLLMGFLKPDSGNIRIEGQEITGLSEDELQTIRKCITLVFQNGALFDSLTVRENIAFPLREREGLTDEKSIQAQVDKLLDLVGAEDTAEDFPSSLSTGRKRAVAIARALAAHPDVVLYDEPTTMVDPIIARRMARLIQKLKYQYGLTSVVVTHDMRFATELADSVVFLHEGEAIFFGSIEDFHSSKNEQIQQFLTLDRYQLPSG